MLNRARMTDIPASQRWSINAVWQIEQERAHTFIEDEANTAYGRSPTDIDNAKRLAPAVWQKIANVFPYDDRIDADLLDAAKNGVLAREAGSRASITIVRILLSLLMGLELAIFAAMWALGDAHVLVVVQGFILAGGSWALGWGLYGLTLSLDHPREPQGSRVLVMVALLFGVGAIASMTAMRVRLSGDGSFAVVAITLSLALLIALLETLNESKSHRYNARHNDMFRAQIQFSNEQHNMHHRLNGDKWMDQFRYAIDGRAKRTPKILDPQEATS